jgi:hypothetical protein
MSATPRIPLADALDMIDRIVGARSWEWAIAHAAHVTGWPVGKLEAALDRRFHDYCAQYGYDYT